MKSCDGFTLIELLVSMAIVSVLASIAIPRYAHYRERGFDTRAVSDLRNAAVAEEAYYIDSEHYLTCADSSCLQLPGIKALSRGVTLTINATATGFTGFSKHPKGSGKVFTWDSSEGGLLE